jgi:hypothetical protein
VSYVCFSPKDYAAISVVCHAWGLSRYPPATFKRLLLAWLADCYPQVAVRVAGLSQEQVQLLYDHMRQSPPAEWPHGLTPQELVVIAQTGIPLLGRERFLHPLRRALIRRLQEGHPDLAMKLERLTPAQFAGLCRAINERA